MDIIIDLTDCNFIKSILKITNNPNNKKTKQNKKKCKKIIILGFITRFENP